jgi:hypothetical protein
MAHRADVFTKEACFTKIFRKLRHHGDGGTHFDPINQSVANPDREVRSAARVIGRQWT